MKRLRAFLSVTVAVLLVIGCASSEPPPGAAPLETVPRVDPSRYVGLWHQVALIPNRFQAACVRETTATYAIRDAGTISVVNRCLDAAGKPVSVEGIARIADTTSNAKLRVSFLPAWLRWTGIGTGNYWVIHLEPDYSLAIVGEPSREFLWVLSRDKQIGAAQRTALQAIVRRAGYDPAQLSWAAAPP